MKYRDAILASIGLSLCVFGDAIADLIVPPPPTVIPLELPEREPPPEVDWGEACITSGTLICKEKRRENRH